MSRIKHSKVKNTGLIFELLVRQVAADTMNGTRSKALQIIKKNFNNNTELNKELKLYRAVHEEKFNSDAKAHAFLYAVHTDIFVCVFCILNRIRWSIQSNNTLA